MNLLICSWFHHFSTRYTYYILNIFIYNTTSKSGVNHILYIQRMSSVITLTQEQVQAYNKVAQEAVRSSELEGPFGRLTLLRELINLYKESGNLVQQAKDFINGAYNVLSFVQGQSLYSLEIKNQELIDQVNKYIIVPFFNTADVSKDKLTTWMALWSRELDSQLRANMLKYMGRDDLANIVILDENQVKYLTGIIRRMSTLIKAKYPDKSADMDFIYASTTQNSKDVEMINKQALILLDPKITQIRDMLNKSSGIMTNMLTHGQITTLQRYRQLIESGDIVKEDLNRIISWLRDLLISNGIMEMKTEAEPKSFRINQIQISESLNRRIEQFKSLLRQSAYIPENVLTSRERMQRITIINSISGEITPSELNTFDQWLSEMIVNHPSTLESKELARKYLQLNDLVKQLNAIPLNQLNINERSIVLDVNVRVISRNINPEDIENTIADVQAIIRSHPQPAAAPPAPPAPVPLMSIPKLK
jgi:hypothetical protein